MAALQGANERDDCDQERQVGACCESAGWGAESASRGWSSFSPLKADCLVSSRFTAAGSNFSFSRTFTDETWGGGI